MPITESGEGYSEWTPLKQNYYSWFVEQELVLLNLIFKKYRTEKWVDKKAIIIDTTSGSGMVDGVNGSPIILADRVLCYPELNFKIVFIDINRDNRDALKNRIGNHPVSKMENVDIAYVCGDNTNGTIHRILQEKKYYGKRRYGWIYHDPNGTAPITKILQPLMALPIFSTLDIVFNQSATNIKRQKCAFEYPGLLEYLKPLGKTYWFMSEPCMRHQWVMLFGMNRKYNIFKSKFHYIDESEGKRYFRKACLTAKQLKIFRGGNPDGKNSY